MWTADKNFERSAVIRSPLALSLSPPMAKRLVTGSRDHTAKLWDVDSGRELRTLKGIDTEIFSTVFSPDGKTLVLGSDRSPLELWRIADGAKLATLWTFEDGHWVISGPRRSF